MTESCGDRRAYSIHRQGMLYTWHTSRSWLAQVPVRLPHGAQTPAAVVIIHPIHTTSPSPLARHHGRISGDTYSSLDPVPMREKGLYSRSHTSRKADSARSSTMRLPM